MARDEQRSGTGAGHHIRTLPRQKQWSSDEGPTVAAPAFLAAT
ncbi:hypothetical protein ACOQFL_16370 [Actinopolyspora sp. H202]